MKSVVNRCLSLLGMSEPPRLDKVWFRWYGGVLTNLCRLAQATCCASTFRLVCVGGAVVRWSANGREFVVLVGDFKRD